MSSRRRYSYFTWSKVTACFESIRKNLCQWPEKMQNTDHMLHIGYTNTHLLEWLTYVYCWPICCCFSVINAPCLLYVMGYSIQEWRDSAKGQTGHWKLWPHRALYPENMYLDYDNRSGLLVMIHSYQTNTRLMRHCLSDHASYSEKAENPYFAKISSYRGIHKCCSPTHMA